MEKLDILGRDEFVDNLFRLIENISDNKSNCCFALNGTWGCGKSFVLDMLEERLNPIQSEETNTDRYFVIRYNFWKYDYYEEPIVAIVAALLKAIERKINLLDNCEEKSRIIGMLKAATTEFLSIANDAISEKYGINIKAAVDAVLKGAESGTDKYIKDHAYDNYFRGAVAFATAPFFYLISSGISRKRYRLRPVLSYPGRKRRAVRGSSGCFSGSSGC